MRPKFTENQLQIIAAQNMLERVKLTQDSFRVQKEDFKGSERDLELLAVSYYIAREKELCLLQEYRDKGG